MSDIKQELDKIRGRISEPSFLKNEGLSNEVGIHVFCYDPADELIVRDFVSRLKAENERHTTSKNAISMRFFSSSWRTSAF